MEDKHVLEDPSQELAVHSSQTKFKDIEGTCVLGPLQATSPPSIHPPSSLGRE
jgi:hypothetical protein